MKAVVFLTSLILFAMNASAAEPVFAIAPRTAWGNGCADAKLPELTYTIEDDMAKVRIKYKRVAMVVKDSATRYCNLMLKVTNMAGKQLELASLELDGTSFIHRADEKVPGRSPFSVRTSIAMVGNMVGNSPIVIEMSRSVGATEQLTRFAIKDDFPRAAERSLCGDANGNIDLGPRVHASLFADKFGGNSLSELGIEAVELTFKISDCSTN